MHTSLLLFLALAVLATFFSSSNAQAFANKVFALNEQPIEAAPWMNAARTCFENPDEPSLEKVDSTCWAEMMKILLAQVGEGKWRFTTPGPQDSAAPIGISKPDRFQVTGGGSAGRCKLGFPARIRACDHKLEQKLELFFLLSMFAL